MKKVILAVALAVASTSAMAWNNGGYHGGYGNRSVTVNNYGGYHGGYRSGYYGGGCYGCGIGAAVVGGAIVGGLMAGALAPTYVAPPVYITPPPVYVAPVPQVPYGYHYQLMFVPECNCTKNVLVPN